MPTIVSVLDALILAAIVAAVLWRSQRPFGKHEWLEKAALGFVSVAAIFGIRQALSPDPQIAISVLMHSGVLAFLTLRILGWPAPASHRGNARHKNVEIAEPFRRRAF